MSKRKSFTAGQPVEIRRDKRAPWEPATYRQSTAAWPDCREGFHEVELPLTATPHYELDGDGEVRFTTPLIRVSTRNVRQAPATPARGGFS